MTTPRIFTEEQLQLNQLTDEEIISEVRRRVAYNEDIIARVEKMRMEAEALDCTQLSWRKIEELKKELWRRTGR
jgi:hypothetical protein